jgi:hypothetical protein
MNEIRIRDTSFSDKYVKVISIDTYTKLVNILKELVSTNHVNGLPAEYIDLHERQDDGTIMFTCTYCGESWQPLDNEQHTDECPIKRGRDIVRNM